MAFNEQVVILPNLKKGKNLIEIEMGPEPSRNPRLIYISKRMPFIRKSGENLELKVITQSKGRFKFYSEDQYVLLNADWQKWNRKGDNVLEGYVTSDRTIKLTKIADTKFILKCATLPIHEIKVNSGQVKLTLENKENIEHTIWFKTPAEPKNIMALGKRLSFSGHDNTYIVTIPAFENQTELLIEL
ncbi:MAG: hypothetical protein EH225_07025 [Calditrichaeota bacterium]|nr:MAG: hypothetical protein EH225_07025 [Calditrichota bacterium]